jgi:hypothetical protein
MDLRLLEVILDFDGPPALGALKLDQVAPIDHLVPM